MCTQPGRVLLDNCKQFFNFNKKNLTCKFGVVHDGHHLCPPRSMLLRQICVHPVSHTLTYSPPIKHPLTPATLIFRFSLSLSLSPSPSLPYSPAQLAIVSISELHTRANGASRTAGLLLGRQRGLQVDVLGACALDTESWKSEAFARKMALYRSSMGWETIGWFLTSTDVDHDPNEKDGKYAVMELHNDLFVEYSGNQAPLYISFNPDAGDVAGELSLRVFESSLMMMGASGATRPKMVQKSYVVRASPWESAVGAYAKRELLPSSSSSSSDGAGAGAATAAVALDAEASTDSSVARRMVEIQRALRILNGRVKKLRAFIARVEGGGVAGEEALPLVRLAASICHRLPVLDTRDFKAELRAEYTDAMLITYLATITKSQLAVSAVLDKSERAFGSSGRGGGMGFSDLGGQDGSIF